jgi:hypothetical protein
MAFKDEGTPRWETCEAGGSGDTVVNADTDEFLLVKGDRAAGAKYATVELTDLATEIIKGVTRGVDSEETMDPYELSTSRKVSIKTSKKMRARTATAYVVANYGQTVVPDATAGNEGYVDAHATDGVGRCVGGETIDTRHYLDFFLDESS